MTSILVKYIGMLEELNVRSLSLFDHNSAQSFTQCHFCRYLIEHVEQYGLSDYRVYILIRAIGVSIVNEIARHYFHLMIDLQTDSKSSSAKPSTDVLSVPGDVLEQQTSGSGHTQIRGSQKQVASGAERKPSLDQLLGYYEWCMPEGQAQMLSLPAKSARENTRKTTDPWFLKDREKAIWHVLHDEERPPARNPQSLSGSLVDLALDHLFSRKHPEDPDFILAQFVRKINGDCVYAALAELLDGIEYLIGLTFWVLYSVKETCNKRYGALLYRRELFFAACNLATLLEDEHANLLILREFFVRQSGQSEKEIQRLTDALFSANQYHIAQPALLLPYVNEEGRLNFLYQSRVSEEMKDATSNLDYTLKINRHSPHAHELSIAFRGKIQSNGEETCPYYPDRGPDSVPPCSIPPLEEMLVPVIKTFPAVLSHRAVQEHPHLGRFNFLSLWSGASREHIASPKSERSLGSERGISQRLGMTGFFHRFSRRQSPDQKKRSAVVSPVISENSHLYSSDASLLHLGEQCDWHRKK